MTIYYQDDRVTVHRGDCLDVLAELPEASVDAVVTDPPYGLEFMGKGWDAPWQVADVNADAGFNGGGISATRKLPSYTGSTNPKCLNCKGTRRGRRDGTAKVRVCLCTDGGEFPNYRAVEMEAFGEWCRRWASECLRVLKPGGHLLAFGGTRTWHRLACAIEDAGFEVRDSIAWLYGSGFPKSLDVSKAIDKAARGVPQGGADPTSPNHGKYRTTTTEGKRWDGDSGQGYGAGGSRFLVDGAASGSGTGRAESGAAETACEAARQWEGWGTALKPAHEPIVVARKPLAGTVAANVTEHGTGALNIDACRVDSEPRRIENYASTGPQGCMSHGHGGGEGHAGRERTVRIETAGRWPTNVVLDIEIADQLDAQTGVSVSRIGKPRGAAPGDGWGMTHTGTEYADTGGASRFFPVFRYEAKAPGTERPSVNGVAHPTVKPLDLMRWLVRLVTPPNGVVLDPFAGSGTTVEAAMLERVRCIAIEREADYLPLIDARIQRARKATAQGVLDLWGAGA